MRYRCPGRQASREKALSTHNKQTNLSVYKVVGEDSTLPRVHKWTQLYSARKTLRHSTLQGPRAPRWQADQARGHRGSSEAGRRAGERAAGWAAGRRGSGKADRRPGDTAARRAGTPVPRELRRLEQRRPPALEHVGLHATTVQAACNGYLSYMQRLFKLHATAIQAACNGYSTTT